MQKIIVSLMKKENRDNLEKWLASGDRSGMVTFNELAEIAATGELQGEGKYQLSDCYYTTSGNNVFNLYDDKNLKCIPTLLKNTNYCIKFINTSDDGNKDHYFIVIKKNPTDEDICLWQNIYSYSKKFIRWLMD